LIGLVKGMGGEIKQRRSSCLLLLQYPTSTPRKERHSKTRENTFKTKTKKGQRQEQTNAPKSVVIRNSVVIRHSDKQTDRANLYEQFALVLVVFGVPDISVQIDLRSSPITNPAIWTGFPDRYTSTKYVI
jgi:hypothetical protein